MRRAVFLAVLAPLAGCALPPEIGDISDSSLKVQVNVYTPPEAADAKAAEGCALYGKKPTYISTQTPVYYAAPTYRLYACN